MGVFIGRRSNLPGWPITLRSGPVVLRPHRRSDARDWSAVRLANEAWLAQWEPSAPVPWSVRHGVREYHQLYKALRIGVKIGAIMPFVITVDGEFAGQLSFANIVRGAVGSTVAGYWLDQRVAGRGVMPTALALGVDFALGLAQLHRVEVNIRPENQASIRVVEKLNFRREGFHERFMHVDGAWRDHVSYALTVEDLPRGGLSARAYERS